MNPKLSIIISTWNCLEHLQRCISSLEQISLPTTEILIIDSGSTDGTRQYAESIALGSRGRIRLTSKGKRLTWSEANQIGLDKSVGEWICLSNPDIIFNEGFTQILEESEREGLDVAVPQLIFPDGRYQWPSKVLTPELFLWLHSPILRLALRDEPIWQYRYDTSRTDHFPVPFPQGSLFLVHRKVVDATGRLWADGYQNGVSDLDAFLNMKEKGVRIWMFPGVKMIHYGSYVSSKVGHGWIERDQANGFVVYFRRHRLSNKISPGLYSLLFAIEGMAETAFVLFAHFYKKQNVWFNPSRRAWMAGQRILGLIDGWKVKIEKS